MYLYISEDNIFRQSPLAPTTTDIDSVDAGILSVFRVTEAGFEILTDQGWSLLEESPVDDCPDGPYHSFR